MIPPPPPRVSSYTWRPPVETLFLHEAQLRWPRWWSSTTQTRWVWHTQTQSCDSLLSVRAKSGQSGVWPIPLLYPTLSAREETTPTYSKFLWLKLDQFENTTLESIFTLYLQIFTRHPQTCFVVFGKNNASVPSVSQAQGPNLVFVTPIPGEAEPILAASHHLNPSSPSRWTWRWGSAYLTPAKDQSFRIQSRLTPSPDSVLPATDSGRSVQQDYENSLWMSQQASPSLWQKVFFLLSHPLYYSPSCCFLNSWFCWCFYGWRTLFFHRKSQPHTWAHIVPPSSGIQVYMWLKTLFNMAQALENGGIIWKY